MHTRTLILAGMKSVNRPTDNSEEPVTLNNAEQCEDRNSKLINYVSKEVSALKATETRLLIDFNFYAHLVVRKEAKRTSN
jgi:hypothetical protein